MGNNVLFWRKKVRKIRGNIPEIKARAKIINPGKGSTFIQILEILSKDHPGCNVGDKIWAYNEEICPAQPSLLFSLTN
jgi:hypothetical protein